MEPHQYKNKILLAVSGLSPQIITETLYALAVTGQPAFVPDEIHVITTIEGKKRIQLMLLDSSQGHLSKMKQDYPVLSSVKLTEETIYTIAGEDSEHLNDIRTLSDNECCANTIVQIVQRLTSFRDTALHVSIAGGRKTMGFYLGNAISLLGRQQDRLSHVLVSEPFENDHQFYYPPPTPKVLIIHNTREPVSTADAHIHLAEIPFLRLRGVLPDSLISQPLAYSEVIEEAQSVAPLLEFVYDENTVVLTLSGKVVKLPPGEMAFYYLLLTRCVDGREGLHASDKKFQDEYLQAYALLFGTRSGHYEQIERRLDQCCHSEYIQQTKSRINRKIKNELGAKIAEFYRIKNNGQRPVTRSTLDLPAASITIARKS